ncbi:Leucine Rich repeats (2 copies) [Symmachiella macrocystis]|uniref:Leucine Rich repeats (2 copies) n=1 Tax=Symmachiella macrocystis TaxID=2527985 RepID=A0A5C6BP73_9PLAN|nr:hypothetical protein [Symmachiella macrocystis]TWU13567.1 Leucine Rich repeats (2 copies) [Symmachiella macrocystis]
MADAATQLPKTKRRARWPYLLAVVALLAVISVKWLVPIALEQRAIAVIRAECPDVDVDVPEFMPDGRKGPSRVGWMHLIHTRRRQRTLVKTDFLGPTELQRRMEHGLLWVVSIDGPAEYLRPAASQLHRLQSVERIKLDDATDEDLVYLGQLSELEDLNVAYSDSITDAGLVQLGGLSQLKTLSLQRTGITDAGLKHLLTLDNLEDLDLSETKVTFDGVRVLRACGNLRRLGLGGVKLTDAQFDELQQDLPGCEVTRYWSTFHR